MYGQITPGPESCAAASEGRNLEDKSVQQPVTKVLGVVFEKGSLGFSYGVLQGRDQQDALDALTVGICRRKVKWVLGADIQSGITFMQEIKNKYNSLQTFRKLLH